MESFAGHRLVSQLSSATSVEHWQGNGPNGPADIYLGTQELLSRAATLPAWGPFARVRSGVQSEKHYVVVPGAILEPLGRLAARLSPGASVALAWHIASALAELHDRGEAHGALHPEHVGLDGEGQLVIRPALGATALADPDPTASAQATDSLQIAALFAVLPQSTLDDAHLVMVRAGMTRERARLRIQPARAIRQALAAVLQRHPAWERELVDTLGPQWAVGQVPHAWFEGPAEPSLDPDEDTDEVAGVAPAVPEDDAVPEGDAPPEGDAVPEGDADEATVTASDVAGAPPPDEEDAPELEHVAESTRGEAFAALPADPSEPPDPIGSAHLVMETGAVPPVRSPVLDPGRLAALESELEQARARLARLDGELAGARDRSMQLEEAVEEAEARHQAIEARRWASEQAHARFSERLAQARQARADLSLAPAGDVERAAQELTRRMAPLRGAMEEARTKLDRVRSRLRALEEDLVEATSQSQIQANRRATLQAAVEQAEADAREHATALEAARAAESSSLHATPAPIPVEPEEPENPFAAAGESGFQDVDSLYNPAVRPSAELDERDEDSPSWMFAKGVTNNPDREKELGAGKWTEPARSLDEVQKMMSDMPTRELRVEDVGLPWLRIAFFTFVLVLGVWWWARPSEEQPSRVSASAPPAAREDVVSAAPVRAEVTVTTDRPGARVLLDGVDYGPAPAVVPVPDDDDSHKLCLSVGLERSCRDLKSSALVVQDPYRFNPGR